MPYSDSLKKYLTPVQRKQLDELLELGYDNAIFTTVAAIVPFPDHEDVYNEAWSKLLEALEKKKSIKNLHAYFFRIAYNEAISFLRKRKRQQRYEQTVEQLPETSKEVLSMIEYTEKEIRRKKRLEKLMALANELLHELPIKNRVPYLLHRVDGMSFRDIGTLMGVHEDTVRKRVRRAEKLLSDRTQQLVIHSFAALISSEHIATLTQNAINTFLTTHDGSEVAVTAAATTGAAAGASSVSLPGSGAVSAMGFLSYLALPLFALISLFVGGCWTARRTVMQAPTLQARRWFVKHLAIFYGMTLGFLMYYMVIHTFLAHVVLLHQANQWVTSIVYGSYGVLLSIALFYLAWLSDHSKAAPTDTESDDEAGYTDTKHRITATLRWWSYGIGLFYLWIFFATIAPNLLLLVQNFQPVKLFMLIGVIVVMVLAALMHRGTIQLFHHFFDMTENERIFQATRKDPPSSANASNGPLLFFAFFSLIPSLGQLTITKVRIEQARIELLLFSCLWIAVFFLIRRYPSIRMRMIVGTFLFQVILMQIFRDLIFV